MTKKDLLEAIEDMPDDADVLLYSGAFFRKLEFVEMRDLWCNIGLKFVGAIALHPAYKHLIVK